MNDFITISRNDYRFLDYLKGTFARDQRAIPTESLNVKGKKDYVVFKIVPVTSVPKPNWIEFLWKTLRVPSLTLSMGPLLTMLTYISVSYSNFDRTMAWLCLLPVLLFHLAMNLINDYYDHLKGIDGAGAVKSIQLGWVRGIDLYRCGLFLLGVGVAIGVYILLVSPQQLFILSLLSGFGVLQFSSNRFGLKYHGFGELTVFLLSGPLLCIGYSWAVMGKIDGVSLLVGLFLGSLSLFVIHINNLKEILTASHAGVVNLSTIFGFDKGKKIGTTILLVATSVWWFLLFSTNKGFLAYGFWFLGVLILKLMWFKMYTSNSSVASSLRELVANRFSFHILLVGLLCLSLICP